MGKSIICDQVIEELKLIPQDKLLEVYDFIHYFRVGLEQSKENKDIIMKFAGCWGDLPDEVFNEFLEEIGQRRQLAFSRRLRGETSIG